MCSYVASVKYYHLFNLFMLTNITCFKDSLISICISSPENNSMIFTSDVKKRENELEAGLIFGIPNR